MFGNGGRHTVKGGTGSGDVNSREVINVEQGLEAADAAVYVLSRNSGEGKDRLAEEGDFKLFAVEEE